jgi:CRISPR/Cas system-associated endonuclease Cas3-HD
MLVFGGINDKGTLLNDSYLFDYQKIKRKKVSYVPCLAYTHATPVFYNSREKQSSIYNDIENFNDDEQ